MLDVLSYYAVFASISIQDSINRFAAPCPGGDFAGLPKWYKYLDGEGTGVNCTPVISGINSLWLIVLAVVEILLRVAAMAALIFLIYSSIRFITARGNPDKINSARTAVQDSIIGLLIAIAAVAIVNFVASRFTSA